MSQSETDRLSTLYARLDQLRSRFDEFEASSDPIDRSLPRDPSLIGGWFVRAEARVYRCSDGVLIDWQLNTSPAAIAAGDRRLYARAAMMSVKPMRDALQQAFFRSLDESAARGLRVTRRGRPWIPGSFAELA
jgi:hypothetical protein